MVLEADSDPWGVDNECTLSLHVLDMRLRTSGVVGGVSTATGTATCSGRSSSMLVDRSTTDARGALGRNLGTHRPKMIKCPQLRSRREEMTFR